MSGYSCAFDGFLFGVIPFGFNPFSGGYDEAGFKDALFGKARLGGGTLAFLSRFSEGIGLSPRGRGNRQSPPRLAPRTIYGNMLHLFTLRNPA